MANKMWDEWLRFAECTDHGLKTLHLHRYIFASQYCSAKTVLDAGCGGGYGAKYLADSAEKVTAVDVSDEAVNYAKAHYSADNLEFGKADVRKLDLPDNAFDVVVSFEVIEHLDDPEEYLSEIARVMKPQGTFIMSTPNAPQHIDSPDFHCHKQEFTKDEVKTLLAKYFEKVGLFGQGYRNRNKSRAWFALRRMDIFKLRKLIPYGLRYKLGGKLLPKPLHDLSLDDIEIARDNLELALSLIAVAAGPLNGETERENSRS